MPDVRRTNVTQGVPTSPSPAEGATLDEAAGILALFTTTTLRVLLTIIGGILLALALRYLVHRMTHRLVRAAEPLARFGRQSTGAVANVTLGGGYVDRRAQRADTLNSVLGSAVVVAVSLLVAVTVLQQLGWDVGPLLASAGVVGLAIGFGAQSLVKDVLSGVFMMLEDQYGVGDLIDIGTTVGTVEAVGLRVTRIRDASGTLWYCRNGEILRVGNQSQGWSRAVVDVRVDVSAPLDRTYEALSHAAESLARDAGWSEIVIGEPTVAFVSDLGGAGTELQVTLKTHAGQQGKVASELRRRIRTALDEARIQLAG